MFCIIDSSQRVLQANGKLFFIRIGFRIFGRKPKKFLMNSEAIAELRFYPKYLMLYIKLILLTN